MANFLEKVLCKVKYGKPIVIVSGLPRSGTSMLMNMLVAGGLEAVSDNLRKADEDNLKGYFEFEPVKDLHKDTDKSWLEGARGKVVKVISWLLKDLPLKYNYKVVFVERNLDEIIASQNKMLVNRGEAEENRADENTRGKYDYHLRSVKYDLREIPNFDVLYVNHRDVIQNPGEQAQRINRFLGGRLDESKMAQVVDEKLYRNRK